MARKRNPKDLSVEELRQLLIEKRRSERQNRLEHYRKTGRVIMVDPQPAPTMLESYVSEPLVLEEENRQSQPSKQRLFLDRLLFVVEIAAVIGLAFVLLNGINVLRNLNNEVASALELPTLTPTPLISAVILPSGHIPPDNAAEPRFNDAEIPEHLRPLVQSLASIPLPTPGPANATRLLMTSINVDAPIVVGDGWEQLRKGIGQHIGSPNPGQKGNLVLSAHNDIFGRIFRDLDKLKPGDEIIVSTSQQSFVYIVRQTQVVEPTRVEVMAQSGDAVLTLISCYPYMVDNQRIVVTATLQGQR